MPFTAKIAQLIVDMNKVQDDNEKLRKRIKDLESKGTPEPLPDDGLYEDKEIEPEKPEPEPEPKTEPNNRMRTY